MFLPCLSFFKEACPVVKHSFLSASSLLILVSSSHKQGLFFDTGSRLGRSYRKSCTAFILPSPPPNVFLLNKQCVGTSVNNLNGDARR